MKAEIIAVGTELLMGQIANTNAQFISEKLNAIGVGVYYHSVVGDNAQRLTETLQIAFSRSDIVILTGGLGPTQDDMTKETVSKYFSRQLILHKESLAKISLFFQRINRSMSENNIKQAYLPENSIILTNENGTAPGCLIDDNDKLAVLLPGPPKEMEPMFINHVIPYLLKKSNHQIYSQYIRVFGMGESRIETELLDLIDNQTNPTIATYTKDGEVKIRVTSNCNSNEDAYLVAIPIIKEIQKRLGNHIYSMEEQEMEEVVGELLIKNKLTLSTAESCTGGLLGSKITNVSGISSAFYRGFITYSNKSKVELLGVNYQTIENFGAVSSETAKEMAVGARNVSGSDLAVSITGIAGPTGGTETKPVGFVYIALASKDGVICNEFNFFGDRQRVRNLACLNALNMIRLHLLNNN